MSVCPPQISHSRLAPLRFTVSIKGREKMKQIHEASRPQVQTILTFEQQQKFAQMKKKARAPRGEEGQTTERLPPTTAVSSIRTAERVPSKDAPSAGPPLSNGIGCGQARIRSGGFRHSIRYAESERAAASPASPNSLPHPPAPTSTTLIVYLGPAMFLDVS